MNGFTKFNHKKINQNDIFLNSFIRKASNQTKPKTNRVSPIKLRHFFTTDFSQTPDKEMFIKLFY